MSKKANDIRNKLKKKRAKKDHKTMQSLTAVKMISLLVLRNRGYGAKRLTDFNNEFNKILSDLSDGYLSLTDIFVTLQEETGLNDEDLV